MTAISANNKGSEGINYFYHFRKDFLEPYGLAHDDFSDDSFHRRINTINCEYVVRPQVAIWEFADAVLENTQYLEENIEVLEKESLQAFLDKIKKFKEPLEVLNSRSNRAGNF